MSQVFLPWLSSILYNHVLDVAWSREHDENFRIGHLKSKFVIHDDLSLSWTVVDILLTSLASGADDWPSRAIASKQTTNVKKKDQFFKFSVLQTLTLNVQFWSAHHVHGTKLHPKRGCRELNSMEVKSFATSMVGNH